MSTFTERNATAKFIWEGPRWAHMESYLRDLAWRLDLEIKVEIEKHLITESGRCSVTGDKSQTQRFIRTANAAIADYNKD